MKTTTMATREEWNINLFQARQYVFEVETFRTVIRIDVMTVEEAIKELADDGFSQTQYRQLYDAIVCEGSATSASCASQVSSGRT